MNDSIKNIETIEQDQKLRSKWKFLIALFLAITIGAICLFWYLFQSENEPLGINPKLSIPIKSESIINPTTSPSPTLLPIPSRKTLFTDYHIFQSFNNCGPAALSMILRFYGINESQAELGQALRPYQIPDGDNDDKSVTLEELAEYSKKYNLFPYHRSMGNPEVIKQFIASDIPVLTHTWTKPNEDIGHFRVLKGYDNTRGIFIQDDSLQNKNLEYTYEDFNQIWEKFNYEYLVLVPKEKQKLAERILGENADMKTSWNNAVKNSQKELVNNPNNIYARFNLSVALYKSQDYKQSVKEFEKVESLLPFRTLWYQIEPIEAYYELGDYNKVFEITDKVLGGGNRAFSELYILRGKIYLKQGNTESAKSEFQKAIFYNSSIKEAQNLLNSI